MLSAAEWYLLVHSFAHYGLVSGVPVRYSNIIIANTLIACVGVIPRYDGDNFVLVAAPLVNNFSGIFINQTLHSCLIAARIVIDAPPHRIYSRRGFIDICCGAIFF